MSGFGVGRGMALAAAGLTGAAVLTGVGAASAAPALTPLSIVVNSTADTHAVNPGNGCTDATRHCSLRAAIETADAQTPGRAVNVRIGAATYKLRLGGLTVSHNPVTLSGVSAASSVINGQGAGRDLVVAPGANLTLTKLRLTGGAGGGQPGGALANSGTAALIGVTVTANTAASGGGIANGVRASLSLTNSAVTHNTALSATANSNPGGSGGGILNAGTLRVTKSTIAGNAAGMGGFGSANPGGHGGNGGGIANTGSLVLSSSMLSGNAAGTGGIGSSGNEPSGPGGNGGGIYSSRGFVTLTNTIVSGNKAGYTGPLGEAPFPNAGDGGGVWSSAVLQVTGSTFSSNLGETGTGTGGSGGGIFTSGSATIATSVFTGNTAGLGDTQGGNGGAIDNSGTLTLTGSTVANNAAGQGGGSANGGAGGGVYAAAGSASLVGDVFNANTSGAGGNSIPVDPGCARPGVGGDGGAVYSSATLTVTDTTMSGNTTGQGGFNVPPCAGQAANGVGAGLATAGGTASVSYSTIADNSDGIANLAGSTTLGGTIVADSTGSNCAGTISEGPGFNLDSGTTCGFSAISDITATEPMLGALANNGGPTYTQALQSGSAAVDHGGTRADGCPAVDQRGLARPDESSDNGACDIGAYESRGIG